MAGLAGDERLAKAHQNAVSEALQELESYASTRVRQQGANADRATGNLVLAVYHHDTSRELDPQLHTHAVAGNLTYDGTEGRWKALQASDIYQRRAYLSEVYRNALAREVRSLGMTRNTQLGALVRLHRMIREGGYDVVHARGFAMKGSDEYCATPPHFWRDRALDAARPNPNI